LSAGIRHGSASFICQSTTSHVTRDVTVASPSLKPNLHWTGPIAIPGSLINWSLTIDYTFVGPPYIHTLLLHPFNGLFHDNLGKPVPEK